MTAAIDLASLPVEELSRAERLALLPAEERAQIKAKLGERGAAALAFDWSFWGRPDQQEPADYAIWALIQGRGSGKTRTGAETVRRRHKTHGRFALVAPTAGDARDVMVEGPSGILAVSPPHERPLYEPSKRRLTWPNGAIGTTFSADEPERLRGPEHDFAWCDEPASWRFLKEAWNNLRLGLRGGRDPKTILTTTPKPIPLLQQILKRRGTVLTRISTYRNLANLAPEFIEEILELYEGTRLGLQELHAHFLEDVEGALWTLAQIEESRVEAWRENDAGLMVPDIPHQRRIVVGVDPTGGAAECGIVVAGVGSDMHGYVLDDRSLRGSPAAWASAVVAAYHDHKADRVVAEVNFGADMVIHTIATVDPGVPVEKVTASRGKQARADPVSALYEKRRVHHVGRFPALEQQMTQWVPGEGASPDRVDALVWAISELMVLHPRRPAQSYGRQVAEARL